MEFCNCLGQDRSIKIIKSYVEKSSFSGAYIFSGPEGIGKKMVALAIAQELNCSNSLMHPDIHIIEKGLSQIKIEDIRDIQGQANLRPYEGKMKVFIIDNAHKLNQDAANSLLKVLEEPPKDTLIILITHKPQNIIKTVLSRCKQIKFPPMPREELENILVKNYSLEKSAAHFLSYYCEGRIGLALKLKDSPLFTEKNRIFDSFVLAQKNNEYNFAGQNKEELHNFLNILASWFRDIYLLKAGMPENETIHLDRKADLARQAARFSFKQLDDIISAISGSLLYLEKNINSKLILHNLGAQLWKA
ncbi:MAG: AAA family ATPase [Candidatus Omnitrophica bacterium]|nr:AAA family ATPase [Candidatus Omnitrophota bacterium]